MDVKEARLEHDALDLALDPAQDRAARATAMPGSGTSKMAPLFSGYVLDTLELGGLGRRETAEMLDIFRASWLRVMEHDDSDRIQSLKELLHFRTHKNTGMQYVRGPRGTIRLGILN